MTHCFHTKDDPKEPVYKYKRLDKVWINFNGIRFRGVVASCDYQVNADGIRTNHYYVVSDPRGQIEWNFIESLIEERTEDEQEIQKYRREYREEIGCL